jgi:hypothetical protein
MIKALLRLIVVLLVSCRDTPMDRMTISFSYVSCEVPPSNHKEYSDSLVNEMRQSDSLIVEMMRAKGPSVMLENEDFLEEAADMREKMVNDRVGALEKRFCVPTDMFWDGSRNIARWEIPENLWPILDSLKLRKFYRNK